MRLLLVEDDVMVASGIKLGLCDAGYAVDWVGSAERAEEVLQKETFDAAIIDIGLPKMDGLSLTRSIRKSGVTMPVLILTARDALQDRVQGLDLGADDYMVKPFKHPSELVARIRTRLRRSSAGLSGQLTLADLAIDLVAHQVTRGGKPIALTRLEFDLLVALAKEPGRVFTRDALLSEVWGYRHSTDTRLVNVHVQRLRAKVEHDSENPEIVVTVRGVGYKAGATGGS